MLAYFGKVFGTALCHDVHTSTSRHRTNFENESERNYIMQTVCEATQAERKELKLAAFECIVHIAELYYDKLAPYIEALYHLTLQTIRTATANDSGDDDEVGQQAVELWSTICEEELELMEDEEIAHAAQRWTHATR